MVIIDFSPLSSLSQQYRYYAALDRDIYDNLTGYAEHAMWQVTKLLHPNNLDTTRVDDFLTMVSQRIMDQWQVVIASHTLQLHYEDDQGNEVILRPDHSIKRALSTFRPDWPRRQYDAWSSVNHSNQWVPFMCFYMTFFFHFSLPGSHVLAHFSFHNLVTMYVERSRSRDDSPPSPPDRSDRRWPAHHQTQLPFPPSSSTSSEAPAWRDVVIAADFSEVSCLADENWNFSAMHPLNHVPLSMMEEKALWQYTRYVYANQVDTYTFDRLLSGIAERIEEQWQISVSPDDLELRYDENHGLEVFQVTSDQPFWNLRNLLDQYRFKMSGSKRDATMAHLPWPNTSRHDASGSASSHSEPPLVLPSSTPSASAIPDTSNLLEAMAYSTTYGAAPPTSSGMTTTTPFVPDTTDGAPFPVLNQYPNERRHPKHQLMCTVVEWNGGETRDLMVGETNLETGRLREHQVEFFFFKLVGDWPTAQRMGNYWRQRYGLETFPTDPVPDRPLATPAASGTETLDEATVYAAQLMTVLRNLPAATSNHSQLVALVRDSEILSHFSTVDLNTLATQIHQLAELVSNVHSLPMEAPQPMDATATDDVHLTAADHNDL
eukprot:s3879_g5.t1